MPFIKHLHVDCLLLLNRGTSTKFVLCFSLLAFMVNKSLRLQTCLPLGLVGLKTLMTAKLLTHSVFRESAALVLANEHMNLPPNIKIASLRICSFKCENTVVNSQFNKHC